MDSLSRHNRGSISMASVLALLLCMLLAACGSNSITVSTGNSSSGSSSSSGNGTGSGPLGSGVEGVQVFVEPDAGDSPITNAITSAKKSVWLEMYLLSDRNVISALEDAANKGVDVRVMLEPHPFGGGPSPSRTMDQLRAAGIKVQPTDSRFALTHEKGMIIDGSTAFIMTSNFTRAALGGSSGSSGSTNREYDIIDRNPQDVQAVTAIFNADWSHSDVHVSDPNLVISPINSRNDFTSLINSARQTLLIEAEEMNDSDIEQAIASAAQRGVHVQVIVPAPKGSSGYSGSSSSHRRSSKSSSSSSSSSSEGDTSSGSSSPGIAAISRGGTQVREDARLYMHAKIIVVDGQRAFVGSENISTQSLDKNRELGIIVSDRNVLNTLEQTFQQDWSDSQAA